ncbi:hypothetical protein ACJJTC_001066 [Scirpophaga incertulas]
MLLAADSGCIFACAPSQVLLRCRKRPIGLDEHVSAGFRWSMPALHTTTYRPSDSGCIFACAPSQVLLGAGSGLLDGRARLGRLPVVNASTSHGDVQTSDNYTPLQL